MELKLCLHSLSLSPREGFNRTFMELKQALSDAQNEMFQVLIGPSWN